jgi:hypothetical protein
MGWFSKALARALPPAALLLLLTSCQGRFGRDGLALFPEGSAPHSFFGGGKCTHNTLHDIPTWFCNLAPIGGFHEFGLIESKKALSREEGVKAFLAYDEGRSGASKGEIEADLKGELAGMELTGLGLEKTVDGAAIGMVVFVGTQAMPDGTSITAWCNINKEMVYMPQGVQQCHTGMKILRDRMLEVHQK